MRVCMHVFQVTRHLLKLFDNIADLRFKDSDRDGREEEEKGEVVAVGMYSREGEYVQFSEPCVCEGQVVKKIIWFLCKYGLHCILLYLLITLLLLILIQAECWLGALENTMRCTVRKEIQEAVATYEDKPRDQWLFDYPAQVT